MSKSMNSFNRTLIPHMTDENTESVFSPYSIFSILTMTSAGAAGNTLDEFNKVLFIDQEKIHEEMKSMHQVMKRAGKQISIAEAIFTQLEILEKFKESCVSNYDSIVRKTKFPMPGEEEVNNYVSDHTKGMIPKIVEDLDPLTRMVLINAIYFKAKWKNQFKKNATKKNQDFNSHGENMKVDYMFRGGSKELYSKAKLNGTGFVSCTLPYTGNTFSMMFIKPMKAGAEAMGKLLKNVICDPDFVRKVRSKQTSMKLKRLMIPKFVIESSYKMKPMLLKMGLLDAFHQTKSDFTNMTSEEELLIDEVIHKAKIIVDEAGTEAAAATAVVMKARSAVRKENVVEFVLNRPFFCFIIHNRTNAVLFSSTVVKPLFKK